LRRRNIREATRIEQVASQLDAGVLKDHLQRLIASQGQAMRLFEESGDPLALDVIAENTESIWRLTKELQRRSKGPGAYQPVPDKHLEELTTKYLRQTAAARGALPPTS
jgi:hypothetical protein